MVLVGLPLGGYVKISGMVDESMDKEQLKKPPQDWEFRSKPAWQRLDHHDWRCYGECAARIFYLCDDTFYLG